MKKFIAMLFVVCIVFSLCACGSSGGSGESLTFATGGESGTYYAFAAFWLSTSPTIPTSKSPRSSATALGQR